MKRGIGWTWAVGIVLASAGLSGRAESATDYIPAPERRAELLARVRAADAAREAQKKTGPALTLVENGKPAAVIVTRGAPDAQELQAAETLRDWIKLMSGAELTVAAADPGAGVRIYVGKAAETAGLSLADIESRSGEGLRVKCDGKNVYIAGQSGAATIRAVGRFLEEEFGCRWFADRDWGRHYPQSKTLQARVRTFEEAPGFIYRRIWGAEGAFGHPVWLAWAGHGGTPIPMGHSLAFLPEEEFERHPEWFRLDETGKRVKGPWYNIGHPEVRKRLMAWALEASENGKKAISFSPPDDHREDFSPESKAYDNPEVVDPSSGRVSMTDRFLSPVNEAAHKLYKLDPKPIHGFYAYSDYTLPPTRPENRKIAPNLSVWIAPIRYGRYHPLGHPNSPSIQMLTQVVDGWADCGAMLGWRTYNYNLAEVMTPYSRLSIWAHDLPYLHRKGAIGISLESFNSWEIYAPFLYQSIRLSYDPRLDPWEMMADYWDKAYGPAAEAMERYWLTIDAAFIGMKTDTGSWHALHHVHTPERLKELDGALAEAERLAKGGATENQRHRVAMARRGHQRAVFWRRWYDAMNRGDLEGAKKTYDAWYAYVGETLRLGHGNQYEETYLRRFIGNITQRAYTAVHPKDAPANRVLGVLPDEWKTATRDEIDAAKGKGNPYDVGFDDSGWTSLKTFSDTRNAQGLPEYFGEMWYRTTWKTPKSSPDLLLHFWKADRKVTVYINGRQVNAEPFEAFNGATLDVTGHLKPDAENQITVLVQHVPLPELFLGGLVSPIYLVEKAK